MAIKNRKALHLVRHAIQMCNLSGLLEEHSNLSEAQLHCVVEREIFNRMFDGRLTIKTAGKMLSFLARAPKLEFEPDFLRDAVVFEGDLVQHQAQLAAFYLTRVVLYHLIKVKEQRDRDLEAASEQVIGGEGHHSPLIPVLQQHRVM